MNCHEVMELMQRHLDQDLNDAEHEAMLAHLQQCPDCAEMFSRLQHISRELASLPKVAPPFSLVDSILPQLAEIDRAAGRSPSPPQASAAPTGGGEAPAAPFPAERPRRFRSVWSVAAAGGIVAAGLLLALFINDMDGTKVADEGPLMPRAAGTANESTAQSAQSFSNSASEDSAKADAKAEAPANPPQTGGGASGYSPGAPADSPTPAPSTVGPSSKQNTPPEQRSATNGVAPDVPISGGTTGQSAPSGDTADGAGTDGASGTTSSPGSPSPGAENESALSGTSGLPASAADTSGGGAAGGGAANSGTPAASSGGDKSGSPASTDSNGSGVGKSIAPQESGETNKSGPTPSPEDASASDKRQESSESPGMAGLMMTAGSMLVSEDGVLVATIDPEKRWIVVTTTDGKKTQMFVSASWGKQDTPRLLQWKGSVKLTYSITSANGTVTTMVIDIAKNTESVQKPEA